MAESAIRLEVTGTLDPDAMLFVQCMIQAARFDGTWPQFASRVEQLIELYENGPARWAVEAVG